MKHTKLTLCALAVMFAAGQAFAHTGVRDQVTVTATAGANSYNGFTITHGCGGDSGDAYPVLGQSAVFPTGDRVVWRDAAGTVLGEGGGAGVFPTIVQVPDFDANGNPILDANGNPVTHPEDKGLNLGVNGYGSVSSAFTTAQEIIDPNALSPGVVEGLFWKDGAMEPKLNTITPFKVAVTKIIDPSVKQVNIRIGVINYCDLEKNAANDARGPYKQPKDAFERKIPLLASSAAPDQINVNGAPVYVSLPAGNGDNNRQDWWFAAPYGGSALYNDPELIQPTYWTTLTVINSSATGSRVVSVEPTGAAFDAILTGPNTRPFTKGNSNL
ncbi:hypothetical protein MGMO_41c00020 [Methyloglobulus morosus KoM1]|uniref:Uncharacterized protein n=1 Tax=Methyloglobulus morosus KoM1 TaxID=1116472 RepID=V5E062_9GAMM|nr:hypothetical protein [Methyloglobulus morosus]ESS72936.1 hypothetical protein MGMO_41c00020 [Methyloglobulus morosus KoM1]